MSEFEQYKSKDSYWSGTLNIYIHTHISFSCDRDELLQYSLTHSALSRCRKYYMWLFYYSRLSTYLPLSVAFGVFLMHTFTTLHIVFFSLISFNCGSHLAWCFELILMSNESTTVESKSGIKCLKNGYEFTYETESEL